MRLFELIYIPDQDVLNTWFPATISLLIILCFILILIFLFSRKVTWTWIKAGILNRPVMIIATRDMRFDFRVPKVTSKTWKVKPYGEFIINPRGVRRLPQGLRGAIAVPEFGVPLVPEHVKLTNLFDRLGINIELGFEGITNELAKKAKEVIKNYILLLEDFLNYVNVNIDPMLIETRVEYSSMERVMEKERLFKPEYIFYLAVLIVCAALAIYLVQQYMDISSCYHQLSQCLHAQQAAASKTGAVIS